MDVGHHIAQGIAQLAFNVAGDFVGLDYGELSIHLDVHVHHAQVAVAARAQVVEGFHACCLVDDSGYGVLLVLR